MYVMICTAICMGMECNSMQVHCCLEAFPTCHTQLDNKRACAAVQEQGHVLALGHLKGSTCTTHPRMPLLF